ncbi:MAG: hypothetical protein ABWZ40_06515 [Caulobacterales bacterium]
MRAGVPASIVLHVGVIVFSVIAWNLTPPAPAIPPSIPISMVKIGPETNLKAHSAEEDPEAIETPVPPQAGEGDPTPGSEAGDESSTNLKAPPPKNAAAEKPTPAPKTPEKPQDKQIVSTKKDKAAPDTKVQKGQEFDFAKMVNKATQTYNAKSKTDSAPNAEKADIGNKSFGAADKMAASAKDAILEQLKRCWRAPADQANPERLIVTVKVFLNRDGSVQRAPTLEKPNPLPVGDRGMVIAWENAKRAVLTCAPYDLPQESYDLWNDLTLRFDPREMAQ